MENIKNKGYAIRFVIVLLLFFANIYGSNHAIEPSAESFDKFYPRQQYKNCPGAVFN